MTEEVVETQKKPIPPAPIPTVEERFGRSEEDVMTDAPLVFTFGGQRHEVKPLCIRESLAWRKLYLDFIRLARQERDTDAALEFGAVKLIECYLDLICEYVAGQITTEEVERGTDEEIVAAWEALDAFVARPFSRKTP
jgi:hypothetical protein